VFEGDARSSAIYRSSTRGSLLAAQQTAYGLGRDREPSRGRGSLRLVPSTSTSNRAQAKYCVGCRTRQKERKQQPRQQKTQRGPPPQSLVLAHRWHKSATGAEIGAMLAGIVITLVTFAVTAVIARDRLLPLLARTKRLPWRIGKALEVTSPVAVVALGLLLLTGQIGKIGTLM
jgi:hypothetical protein